MSKVCIFGLAGDELESLMRRGTEAAAMLATSSAAADEAEKVTFSQLKILHNLFQAKSQ